VRLLSIGLVVALADAGPCPSKHEPHDPAPVWTDVQLVKRDGKAGPIAYEISLPQDWGVRPPPDDGWQAPGFPQFRAPTVSVGKISTIGKTVDDAILTAGGKAEQYVRKDQRPDGYALTEVHNETLCRVTRFAKAGSGDYLWCTASYANDDGIPRFADSRGKLEAICDSVKPK
jgi:hypothetical protein